MIPAMQEDISRSDWWPNTKETPPRRCRNSPQLKNFGAKPIRASSHPEFKSREIPSEARPCELATIRCSFLWWRDRRDAAEPRVKLGDAPVFCELNLTRCRTQILQKLAGIFRFNRVCRWKVVFRLLRVLHTIRTFSRDRRSH